MYVHVPAMRGKIGSRTYYACLMPMSAVPQLFKFTDWVGFTPEEREQRVLNERRVPDIATYITENEDEYLFSSITASYKGEPIYEELRNNGDGSIGTLKLKLGEELVINDGQHRCAAISEAIKQNPKLSDHTLSVLLFPWESKERVQQMFSDLNRYVVKTSKSLDILYDRRDPISLATMVSLDHVPVFRELTEKDATSLPSKATKLFTLAALYDANRELLRAHPDRPTSEQAERLTQFWNEVAKNMPDWTAVLGRHKTAIELRAEKICTHSTILRALGGIGAELIKDNVDWRDRLRALQTIDWSKKNSEWDNVCIIANSVVSNRQARAATKAFLKKKMGMELTDGEARSFSKGE
jgi:DNA sulfur modification protein DndB